MATIWADNNGNIIAAVQTFAVLQQNFSSGPPAGTVTTLDFDETANPALIADLLDNFSLYSLTGGATPVLKKSGVTQVVTNLPGLSTAWIAALNQLNSITLAQIQATVTALMAGTASTAQEQKALAFVILKLASRLF